MIAPTVAVLFARADSVYKTIPDCDVYDIDRDARTYAGSLPIIAHPPCRAWGSLRHFAKPRPDEKDLAIFAVERVRTLGGVLEHPLRSTLWDTAGCIRPPAGRPPLRPAIDKHGGWLLAIDQHWFGHRANKLTFLYIVGCSPIDVPEFPIIGFGRAPYLVSPRAGFRKGMPGWRPELRTDEREHTPPALASWLYHLARRCTTVRAAA